MEIALLIMSVGVLCIGCFLIGAKVGQTVSKGDALALPSVNPFEAYRKNKADKEARAEQERIDTIMRNIDRYDGTSRGQEEVR